MPVVQFYLAQTRIAPERCQVLIQQASELMASYLAAPIARIRVFVNLYAEEQIGAAGHAIKENDVFAPYFECTLLAGRSLEQRQTLMRALVYLLAEVTQADISLIRGCCRLVQPEDWFISDQPASVMRQAEIQQRAQT